MMFKTNRNKCDNDNSSPPQDLFYELGNLIYNPEKKSFLGKTKKLWRRDLTLYSIIWAALVFGLPRLQQQFSVLGSSPRLSFQPVPADERSTLIWYKGSDPNSYKYWVDQLVEFISGLSAALVFGLPRLQQQFSVLGSSPRLSFQPVPADERSTLIWYKGSDPNSYKYWVDQLVEFISDYKKRGLTATGGQNIVNCDFHYPPPPGKFCDVDIRGWGPCIEENRFSYHKSSPCIFLRLDKLYGWRPEFYNDTNNLPQDMPMDLQSHIKTITANNPVYANTVWVSCEGVTPADKEFIGPVSYLPYPGFPGYFYPYENVEGYLSPLVAIHLQRPKTGIIINIECRAWAKNIVYERQERLGIVNFEVMID